MEFQVEIQEDLRPGFAPHGVFQLFAAFPMMPPFVGRWRKIAASGMLDHLVGNGEIDLFVIRMGNIAGIPAFFLVPGCRTDPIVMAAGRQYDYQIDEPVAAELRQPFHIRPAEITVFRAVIDFRQIREIFILIVDQGFESAHAQDIHLVAGCETVDEIEEEIHGCTFHDRHSQLIGKPERRHAVFQIRRIDDLHARDRHVIAGFHLHLHELVQGDRGIIETGFVRSGEFDFLRRHFQPVAFRFQVFGLDA